MTLKLPEKGEMVLLLDLSGTEDASEEYRKNVLKTGGRVRVACGIEAFQRHLQVYTPSFVVVIK